MEDRIARSEYKLHFHAELAEVFAGDYCNAFTGIVEDIGVRVRRTIDIAHSLPPLSTDYYLDFIYFVMI